MSLNILIEPKKIYAHCTNGAPIPLDVDQQTSLAQKINAFLIAHQDLLPSSILPKERALSFVFSNDGTLSLFEGQTQKTSFKSPSITDLFNKSWGPSNSKKPNVFLTVPVEQKADNKDLLEAGSIEEESEDRCAILGLRLQIESARKTLKRTEESLADIRSSLAYYQMMDKTLSSISPRAILNHALFGTSYKRLCREQKETLENIRDIKDQIGYLEGILEKPIDLRVARALLKEIMESLPYEIKNSIRFNPQEEELQSHTTLLSLESQFHEEELQKAHLELMLQRVLEEIKTYHINPIDLETKAPQGYLRLSTIPAAIKTIFCKSSYNKLKEKESKLRHELTALNKAHLITEELKGLSGGVRILRNRIAYLRELSVTH